MPWEKATIKQYAFTLSSLYALSYYGQQKRPGWNMLKMMCKLAAEQKTNPGVHVETPLLAKQWERASPATKHEPAWCTPQLCPSHPLLFKQMELIFGMSKNLRSFRAPFGIFFNFFLGKSFVCGGATLASRKAMFGLKATIFEGEIHQKNKRNYVE